MLQVVKWTDDFFFPQWNTNVVLISLFVGRWFYAVKLSPLRRRDTIEYIITLSGLAKSMCHWFHVMEETRVGPNIQHNYSLQIKSFINYKVCIHSCTPSSTALKKCMAEITRNFRHCTTTYDVGVKLFLKCYASCGTFACSNVSLSSALCCVPR